MKLTDLDRLARLVVRAAESLDVDEPYLVLFFSSTGWEAQLSVGGRAFPKDMAVEFDGVSFWGSTAETATKRLVASLAKTRRLRDACANAERAS